MKKRAVALLMAALIGTVGMTGCGNSQTETPKDTVEETVKQDATEAEEALSGIIDRCDLCTGENR